MLKCRLTPSAEGYDGHFRSEGRTLRIALRPDPQRDRRRYRLTAGEFVIGYAEPIGEQMMMVKACLPFWSDYRQGIEVLAYRQGEDFCADMTEGRA